MKVWSKSWIKETSTTAVMLLVGMKERTKSAWSRLMSLLRGRRTYIDIEAMPSFDVIPVWNDKDWDEYEIVRAEDGEWLYWDEEDERWIEVPDWLSYCGYCGRLSKIKQRFLTIPR